MNTKWVIVNKCDIRARGLADKHYSRQKKYTAQFTRPGNNLVLLTQDCSAVWVTWKPTNGIKRMDGMDGFYECTLFRNEGMNLSSDLIEQAIELTESVWGEPVGWLTYIKDSAVKSINPGYCYKCAGFKTIGRNKNGKLTKLVRVSPIKLKQGF
jgi:hypothetical protein